MWLQLTLNLQPRVLSWKTRLVSKLTFLLATLHSASTLLATINFLISGLQFKMCLTWTRPCARCKEEFTERSVECTERQKGAPNPMDVSSAHTVERIFLEPLPRCQSFYCRRLDRLEACSTYAVVQGRDGFNKQFQEKIQAGEVARMGTFHDDLAWAVDFPESRWGFRMPRDNQILLWMPTKAVMVCLKLNFCYLGSNV